MRYGLTAEAELWPFETAASAEQRSKDAERSALDLKTSLLSRFEKWKIAEDAYASATGDFDAGIWID